MAASASAQSLPTATRTGGAYVFGGASYFKPDYGTVNDAGFVIGGAWTRYISLGGISLEPRFGYTSGDLITQKYFLLNLKLEHPFGKRHQYHVFAEGGVGIGQMNVGHPILINESSKPIEAFTGGLDYDVTENIGVKAEYQYQFWDFGYYSNGLTPNGADVAIYYRITGNPFHRKRAY